MFAALGVRAPQPTPTHAPRQAPNPHPVGARAAKAPSFKSQLGPLHTPPPPVEEPAMEVAPTPTRQEVDARLAEETERTQRAGQPSQPPPTQGQPPQPHQGAHG